VNARGDHRGAVARRVAAAFGVAILLLTAAGIAGAQTAPRFEDTTAQRVLACTGCHGAQGRAASDGYYPRIAGKPPLYLYHQLVSFRDGRREYPLMANLLATLDDAYLKEIAGHFASLDIPYPPPQPPSADAATLARGEQLVQRGDPARNLPSCVQCHGSALMGVQPAIPALLGMPRDYLNGQLGAWRSGARHALAPDCMAQVAQRLDAADISAVSQWLAAQPVPAGAHPADALPAPLPLACGGVPAGSVR